MAGPKTEGDKFGHESQLNARLDGSYWTTAKEVENNKCVFCDLKEKYIVTRNDQGVLTTNIFPYIDGQLIVLPHRHIVNFTDLTEEEVLGLHRLTKKGVELLNTELGIDNIWIILRDGNVAGKTVKHLHWNIMPYVEGLNTWHYDFAPPTIKPIDLAAKLRASLENDRT